MRTRRLLSILLAVVMIIACGGIMSGCGEKDPAIEGAVDLGGRTIKILSWGKTLGGVYVDPDDTSELGEIKKERLAEMEELYNCKFELELMDAAEYRPVSDISRTVRSYLQKADDCRPTFWLQNQKKAPDFERKPVLF